jgi:hypothetical protein
VRPAALSEPRRPCREGAPRRRRCEWLLFVPSRQPRPIVDSGGSGGGARSQMALPVELVRRRWRWGEGAARPAPTRTTHSAVPRYGSVTGVPPPTGGPHATQGRAPARPAATAEVERRSKGPGAGGQSIHPSARSELSREFPTPAPSSRSRSLDDLLSRPVRELAHVSRRMGPVFVWEPLPRRGDWGRGSRMCHVSHRPTWHFVASIQRHIGLRRNRRRRRLWSTVSHPSRTGVGRAALVAAAAVPAQTAPGRAHGARPARPYRMRVAHAHRVPLCGGPVSAPGSDRGGGRG